MDEVQAVGVHGVGNYRAGETPAEAAGNLTAIWREALRRGSPATPDGGLNLNVVYYADRIRDVGRQGSTTFEALSPAARNLVQIWLDGCGLPDAIAQGRGTYPLRQAIAWLARRDGLSVSVLEWFIATFFSEVATLLDQDNTAVRAGVRQHLLETIERHGATVVIAHSLGSVVAYEALWQAPELPVDLLVTIGSPLALPHIVFPRLQHGPKNGRGACPPGVARWVNLADPGDLIAIPVFGVSQHFDGVDVDAHTAIGTFDFHLATNYLASPRLVDEIDRYLRLRPNQEG
jgi:pimeloyl-ACP methyl ester carboxylesterase